MALDKAGLKTALVAAMTDTISGSPSTEQTNNIDQLATDMADAIDAFVKTGSVNTPAGVAVQVNTGTGTGATTAPGVGTIS